MSKPTDNPSKRSGDRLTTSAGNPIADNQNSLSAGPRGSLLLQDYQLIEKLAQQNRERIPERPVHAKGWGAYGTLTITGDISRYTKAKVLQPGARTPLHRSGHRLLPGQDPAGARLQLCRCTPLPPRHAL